MLCLCALDFGGLLWLLVLIAFNSVIWLLYLALIVFCFYCLGLMLFGLFGLLLSAELLIVLLLYFFVLDL